MRLVEAEQAILQAYDYNSTVSKCPKNNRHVLDQCFIDRHSIVDMLFAALQLSHFGAHSKIGGIGNLKKLQHYQIAWLSLSRITAQRPQEGHTQTI